MFDDFEHFLGVYVGLFGRLGESSEFVGPRHGGTVFAVRFELDKGFIYGVKKSFIVNVFALSEEDFFVFC